MKTNRKIEDFRMDKKLCQQAMSKIAGGQAEDAGGLCIVNDLDKVVIKDVGNGLCIVNDID